MLRLIFHLSLIGLAFGGCGIDHLKTSGKLATARDSENFQQKCITALRYFMLQRQSLDPQPDLEPVQDSDQERV